MAETEKKLLTNDDLMTLHAIWKRVGTRTMIDAVRFIGSYEAPPRPPPPPTHE